MSGIAGIVDLEGRREIPPDVLRRMSEALIHRGPDAETIHRRPGLGFVSRSLAVTSVSGNFQTAAAERDGVLAVFDGQFYNAPEIRRELEQDGETFATGHDGEILAPLWERHGADLLPRLRGQFAMALWDGRRQELLLARDRFGVCPLHWTRQDDWLLFASDVKTLLASGMVEARPDVRGVDHIFTFFGLPGPVTCFEKISALLPGRFLKFRWANGNRVDVTERIWWQLDLSAAEQAGKRGDETALLDEYEGLMLQSLRRRLRADEPLAAYSSGGLDSSMLVLMIGHLREGPLDTFTFRIRHPHLDESRGAVTLAEHAGTRPHLVDLDPSEVIRTFPRVVRAAESPVIDASAAPLFRLAEAAHEHGFRIALTGEGADEWQAGYPWFRIGRVLRRLNLGLPLPFSRNSFRRYLRWVHSREFPWPYAEKCLRAVGGENAWMLAYMLMAAAKFRFYSTEMREAALRRNPFEEIALNESLLQREDWLNRSIYLGARNHLTGLHLTARGDRSAQRSSVELRYPFLDEDLVEFLSKLPSDWKLRRLEDKALQRRLADRWLPRELTENKKTLLHAPLDAFHSGPAPAFVDQLLSRESLAKSGWFDHDAVQSWRARLPQMRPGFRRLFIEMGLAGVITTQMWYQAYFDASLADLPTVRVGPRATRERALPVG